MGIGKMKRAVFLDRDGVINKILVRHGRPSTPRRFDEFEWVEGIGEEVRRIKDAGFHVFVITNQPDVARGILPFEELEKMSAAIRSHLPVDEVWVCPHDDDAQCDCRKPKSGMVQRAREKYAIDIAESYMIGDGWKDMELARNVGCAGILINAPYNQGLDCFARARNIHEAVDLILSA
jgi:D-glycero-D-manno-heptose 1,7-bisphosphate phosphatase